MSDSTRFQGRTAIVTGAASGIGRATALRLAADGASVACLDQDESRSETVAAIVDAGGTAVGHPVDVRDPDSVAAAVAAAERDLGPCKILANVAGVLRFAKTHEQPVHDWDLVIDVNLKGTFLMARAAIASMIESGGGAIVNVSSTAGLFGQAYNAAYCASKGGVSMLTRSLAVEYLSAGIRVNAIAPSGVTTPMTKRVDFPEGLDFDLVSKSMAQGNRMLDPAEPASLIAYLASDEAPGINGAVIPIDHAVTA